ncbi:hypothetical protein TREMEDRAFT_58587 [Tremella mesenterica DSM 1558]|uniref:uncharacterized protein n=1 Tax=Tremella mesenterica (strain ATCC 24925 / CBS 8224 / DSM 1558 / NBRC 9311 / NRRL Y-6157 / RJB 2259-6 / UBC 559-6) TaxID=578456 RepID=UPI0003F49B13|nr:uncharacterized protein TREMEDRAFT_58587 [Tremella mesenterica DSM 1558]EIW72424.1 hypothetical protein TREMEDRAFT_58587 [Tremella mesenterica DSM 1558]
MSAARRFSSRASTLLHSSSQSSHRPSVFTTNRSVSSAGEKPDKRTGRNVTVTDATTTDNASWDLEDLDGIATQVIQTRRFNRAPLKPRPSSAHAPKDLPTNQSSSRSRFPGLNMSIEPGLQNILKKAQPLPILPPNSLQPPVVTSIQPTPPHRDKRPWTPSPPSHKSRPLHPPTDPYILSERLKTHIKRSFPKPTQADFDVAMSMVYNAPPQMATAPVWGALLTFLGREGRLDTMWRTFNDMKKRGIRPTPYTFTILLNAYAHVPNSYLPRSSRTQSAMLTPRTRDRVQLIYDQYQQYLKRSLAAASEPSETAKATSSKSRSVGGDDSKQIPRQIDIAPTNAYLKFLARYDLLEEMQQTFLQMPTEGPLAPDALTYMIMLRPLNFVKKSPDLEDSSHTPPLNVIGEKVRPLIDQALRQAARMAPVSLIDSTLAQKIILDLSTGRRADQQLSVKLIEILYDFDHHPQSFPMVWIAYKNYPSLQRTRWSSCKRFPQCPTLPPLKSLDFPPIISYRIPFR